MAAERAIDLARKASQTALGWAGGSKKQKKSEAFAMTEEGKLIGGTECLQDSQADLLPLHLLMENLLSFLIYQFWMHTMTT